MRNEIDVEDFQARPGKKIKLRDWPTKVTLLFKSQKQYRRRLKDHIATLASLQRLHYAANRRGLLVIFQGMDAAGKDGAIRHVMSGINPQGCDVVSFKQPSAEELAHDFLWRSNRKLPERGRIAIFNRSYYEEVLVVRVHPEMLKSQGLPKELIDPRTIWTERYRSIADLEAHLHRNGTRIIKIFLHLSKDEQRKRFLARIDDANKNWKFSPSDVEERKFWEDYTLAYESCLGATSTNDAPWFIVPADNKKNARLIISGIILAYPKSGAKQRRELSLIRKRLAK